MRNLFDQYSQPENRITHALATCLNEDKKLLRQFIRSITGKTAPKATHLIVEEQALPGEVQNSEEEAERRGLPDMWVHDGEEWALLIESKVAADLRVEQLRRHYATAQRRGFVDVTVLALGAVPLNKRLPEWARFRQWSEIYRWLVSNVRQSAWAERMIDYLEVAEAQFVEDGYLKEGALTEFSGVPFCRDHPYNYQEGKRLIKLAMAELRKRKVLKQELGIDLSGAGRGAIFGKGGGAVWDFLPLKSASADENFTRYPHFTLAFEQGSVRAILIIPHGIETKFRRNLLDLDYDSFYSLMGEVNKNLVKALRKAKGAAPWVTTVQRRYPSRSSPAINDAYIQFDLRTAFVTTKSKSVVKPQPQWLEAIYAALSNKRSNLEAAVGAIFPYDTCKKVAEPEILDFVTSTFIACKPLVNVMLGKRK